MKSLSGRRTASLAPAMAMIGLMLTSCGQAPPSADRTSSDPTTSASDPCSLLRAEELTAITTDTVTATDRDGHNCHYRSAPNDETVVTVMATGGKKEMDVMRRSAALLEGMGASVADQGGAGADVADLLKPDAAPLPPLGDEALWSTNTTLSVRKGDAFVSVTPPIMHDPANHTGYPLVPVEEKRKIARAVAAKLIARLAP